MMRRWERGLSSVQKKPSANYGNYSNKQTLLKEESVYFLAMCCQSQMPTSTRSMKMTNQVRNPSVPAPSMDPYPKPIIAPVYHVTGLLRPIAVHTNAPYGALVWTFGCV